MGKRHLTEKELVDIQKMQTYYLDMRNNGIQGQIEELDDLLPCIYHLNNKDTLVIEHVNKMGGDLFALDPSQILSMGKEFLDTYIHPDTLEFIPQLKAFYASDDEEAIISYFQKYRPRVDADYEWLFTSAKIYKKRRALITIATPVSQLHEIGNKMNRILDEHSFMKKNFKKFMALTKREKEVMKLLALGHSAKEISEQLFVSFNTIKRHRLNLYKKLEIEKITELIQYAQAFDLI